MRRLSLDQYEFDPPDSEQSLELAISSPRQLPDLSEFLLECGASSDAGTPPPPGWPRWPTVADHLRRYAGLELPHPGQWSEAALLRDEWDEVDLGIAAGAVLIWYHWSTTA